MKQHINATINFFNYETVSYVSCIDIDVMAAYCFTLSCIASEVPENMSFIGEVFVWQFVTPT